MKILQLCNKMPFPPHDGGAFSIYHTALGLISAGNDVKVFAINTPKNWIDEYAVPDGFKAATRFEFVTVDTRFKPLYAFKNLFTSESYFIERFYSKTFNEELIKILRNEKFDIVHLEHLYMCLYLETIRKYSKATVVLRPQNVENQVWFRLIKHKINPVKKFYIQIMTKRLVKFEISMANKVDAIIAISPDDEKTFRSYAPQKPVIFVPIGLGFGDIESYDFQKQFQGFPVFYHLGSMDWFPNVQGLRWFIEDVMPLINDKYPDFVFRIAGKKMPPMFEKLKSDNLVIDGEVPDSLTYHENKAVLIVPVLAGGGLRVKIIEAMALGKTVISTAIGAAGIPYTNGVNILIADTKEEFTEQILKCAWSKKFCKEIGRNAQKLALEYYDRNNTAKAMVRFYNRLIRFN